MLQDTKPTNMVYAAEDSTPTHVPIPPHFASPAHFTWLFITIISVTLFLFGLPHRYLDLRFPSPGVQLALDEAGVSTTGWMIAMLAPEIILMLVYTIIGISLYIQKARSVKIWIVSLLLISWGTTILNVVDALAIDYQILDKWILFSRAVSWSLVMTLLLLFPNGRLYPKWGKWLLAFWFVWIWSWFIFPDLPHNISDYGSLANPFRYTAYFLLITIGIGIQIYRFQKVSSPTERQQSKWAFLGIGIMFILTFLEEAPSAINPALINQNTAESIHYIIASVAIFVIGSLAFPIGIAASIQQKRLWRIDYVINRGLAYTLVTGFLVGVFFIVYHLLQNILASVTGNTHQQLVALISALLAVSLFSPTRARLQRFIDRRFYNIHINYQRKTAPKFTRGFALLEKQKRVGDYEIIEMVAQGGMAEIFKGVHVTTGQLGAVKILQEPYSRYEEYQKRFAHEAQTISHLDHNNITKLYDYGEVGDLFYIIMEFISYQTLATQLKAEQPLSLDFTRHIILQTAQALDYTHQRGIIHRDIKPSNLLLRAPTPGNKYPQPVLSDFGIAKTKRNYPKRLGFGFVGSLDYISPEQIHASENVDQRTDIYSLGVIAFQMLTGQLPFQTNSKAETLIAHLYHPAPNILALNPNIPDPVAFAILKAMANDPKDRFDQAGQFAQALLQN